MSYSGHSLAEFLHLCRDAVGVFYYPSQLGLLSFWYCYAHTFMYMHTDMLATIYAYTLTRIDMLAPTCICIDVWKYMCNIGPKCCVWKKGVRRKSNTQTRNIRKKNSRFYSLGLQRVAVQKVCFIAFFLTPLLGGDGRCHGSWLVDTSVVSWQAWYARVGVAWTSDAPV